VLGDAIDKLTARGILVLVSGIREDHLNRLDALGALDELHADGRIFPSTPDAIGYARAHLAGAGVIPGPPWRTDPEPVGAPG
jgi:SulP family sulfate permease